MTRALGALAMLVVVVAGCAAPAASTPPDPTSSTAVPTASPTATPTPLPPTPAPSPVSPDPSASPWTGSADTLAWHRLGVIPATRVNGVVGFDEGYVALEGTTGSVWFSADGASWKNVKLPFKGDRSEATDANGLLGRAIATNGREVLVVGGYSHTPCSLTEPGSTGGGPDCSISPIAWISDDGVAWRRAYTGHGKGELSELVAAWPVAEGGWAAALSEWSGESLGGKLVWHSADGTSWTATEQVPPAGWEGYESAPVGVANPSGPYLLASSGYQPDTTLATTADGASWSVLDGFPGQGAEVLRGDGPSGRSQHLGARRKEWLGRRRGARRGADDLVVLRRRQLEVAAAPGRAARRRGRSRGHGERVRRDGSRPLGSRLCCRRRREQGMGRGEARDLGERRRRLLDAAPTGRAAAVRLRPAARRGRAGRCCRHQRIHGGGRAGRLVAALICPVGRDSPPAAQRSDSRRVERRGTTVSLTCSRFCGSTALAPTGARRRPSWRGEWAGTTSSYQFRTCAGSGGSNPSRGRHPASTPRGRGGQARSARWTRNRSSGIPP